MKKNKFKKEYFENYTGGNLPSKEFLLDFIKKLPKNAKILDVGCGKGTYLKEIHKIRPDLKLYGVDIGEVEEFLPEYINFTRCSGDNLPFEYETFDFVFCFHVLEHVLNPHDFMMEFNRVLKKNGYVYIEMPYYKTAYIPDGSMNFWSDPTHIRPYSYKSIESLLKENGFKVIKIKVWRNWKSILLGPYLILKRILFNDKDALSTFFAHLYGNAIGGLGKKL
ncbi:class I SAM-dependent methyltransferase [Methanocaldococcus sp. 10A]